MKIYFKILTGIILLFFVSCLKRDLPELPSYHGNDITSVYIEYRFLDESQMYNGAPVVAYQKLIVNQQIDTVDHTINIDITVPAANGSFTEEERSQVKLKKLWPYFDISTAASINATGSTPAPGDLTDCSTPLTYEVKAANGQVKNWEIIVKSFNK